jgi:hypothetical protein
VLGICGPALMSARVSDPSLRPRGAAGLVPYPVKAADPVGLVHVTRFAVPSRVNAAQAAFEFRPARGC